MPFPILARKVKELASQQLLQLKQLLTGRGFAKFKRLYRIKGELGQGGFGVVYRGVRLADGLPVAVKFIERRHVREWGRLAEQRVPMEICMLARCGHLPGVIGLLDWFALPEGFLLVMERPSPCMDLFDFIHQQKCLDEPMARFIFAQVVHAVAECAERRVLHRDIKDENVLLELATGRVRLIDFGAATLLNRTRYADFQGTRLYCPPEWFLHSLYLGREAAIWSLGVLLYNMLNGRLPFLNEKDICTAHLLGPLPFFAPLSREVRDLLGQCLSFDPFARPSLEQIMGHPWLAKPCLEWAQLAGNSEWHENDKAAAEQRHESGLSSECSENHHSGVGTSMAMAVTAAGGNQVVMPTPTTAAAMSTRQRSSLGIRRNARTANLGWQADVVERQPEEADAYSIVRPGLRQFELCPAKAAGIAAGSFDSGTASALHSPRSTMPNDNPFPEFC